MKTIDRIYHFLNENGITLAEFSRKINVSNGYLAKMKKSSANVGSHILEKIVSEYPDLNPIWLLKGTGEMLLSQECTTDQERTDRLRALEAQPPAHARGADALTREKIGRLEDKIKSMERENALLREMIDVLKATQ